VDGYYEIMSLKLSSDSREVLAGTKSADILTYDLISNRVSTKVTNAHRDEINSVCWANREESNVLFTGSDDCTIRVWDKRALGSNSAMGVFIGHTEGITNVSSKGDGMYLASNGKDQLLKVWDLRKMVSVHNARWELPIKTTRYDYRWQNYPLVGRQTKLPKDHSLFTFMGHQVLETLIRCQFSPLETTGQRYLYSGSACGKVFIYDLLTGDLAQVLEASEQNVARDVSWHPKYPVLASTSFSGDIYLYTAEN